MSLYWDRRNAGLCVACGKPSGGKCLCPACGEVRYNAVKKEKKTKLPAAEESPKVNSRCKECRFWRSVGKGKDCFGYCNFFFLTGKTRLSLHKKQYLRLKTAQGRENFLRRMNENCREWEEGKPLRASSPWLYKNGRKKKNV